MSKKETNTTLVAGNTQGKGKKKNPLAFLLAPLLFAGSLTLGIVLLAVLIALLAWGTFVESEYGSAVARFVVYGNPWFHRLLALLALNIVFSAFLRFPWRRHHIPFLTAHGGILILLLGCYLTWHHGEEAQITLPEGTVGRVAIKPEQQQFEFKFIAHSANSNPKPFYTSFQPGPFSWQDYQYNNWIRDGKSFKTILWHAMRYIPRDVGEKTVSGKSPGNAAPTDSGIKIEVLDYYAHSGLEPVPPLDVNILWNKTVHTFTDLGDSKEVPRNWEMVRMSLQSYAAGMSDVRGFNTTMSQGERVSYCLATSQEELTAFQKGSPKGGDNAGLWGEVVLYYGGEHYHVNADQIINLTENQRFRVGNTGLQIGDVRFWDRGPIIRFVVFAPSGVKEAMSLFPDNPELNVHARKLGVFGSYWVDPQRIMQQSAAHADNPRLQQLSVQRLDFMQGTDKKLYYRLWSGQKIVADGVVPDQELSKKPRFKLAERTPDEVEIVVERFVSQDVPGHRIVPAPATGNQHNQQRVKLRVVFEGKEDTFWIRSAVPTVVPLPPDQDQIRYIYGHDRTLSVEINFEAIDLGFGILLKNFEKRTEPGTRMPSHFSSLIDYVESKDPANKVVLSDRETWFSRKQQDYRTLPAGENILISMNRPGFFKGTRRGYRIYQSSYLGPFYPDQPQFQEFYDGSIFPWETQPRESIAMSTFSVNADPGRGYKYFGSFLIVLGMMLFIWKKHW